MIFQAPAKVWFLLSTSVLAQRISEVLATRPELSILSNYISSFPRLEEPFTRANNFTFLAPTNDAFKKWLAMNHTTDYMEATFMYHLLRGVHTTGSINEVPQFISSFLTNASFSHVSNGQRVGAFKNEHVLFESALKTTSSVVTGDIVATGGLVHTIDAVLQIPAGGLTTAALMNLSYFTEINFFGVTDRPLIDSLLAERDKTFFLPNSAKALSNILRSPTFANDETLLGYFGQYARCSKLVFSTDFVDGALLMTDGGVTVVVTVLEGEVYINNAKVLERDVLMANGVFHIIDDALIPSIFTTPNIALVARSISKRGKFSTAAKVKVGIFVAFAGIAILLLAFCYIWFHCLGKGKKESLETEEQHELEISGPMIPKTL
ncbi:FAS1 domain-containing protein [Cadophora sp. DSE1049]|nr:FAS1 domain-containing protein [Cadophora sp. DSE1049]